MKNISYIKIVLAALVVIALCLAAGAMIPGNPIKPLIDNVADGLRENGRQTGPGDTNSTAGWTERPFIPLSDFTAAGSGYMTLHKAMDLARSDDEVATWLSDHPASALENIQTEHMNPQGWAYDWTVEYVADRDVMIVDVRGGKVHSRTQYNTSSSVTIGMSPDGLQDSTAIMDTLMASCIGLRASNTTTPFSLQLLPGENAFYTVNYATMANTDDSYGFSATFDARSGALLENTWGGVVI